MPVYRLGPDPVFPPASFARGDGLLCLGGDLAPQRLLTAYQSGIFPWPHEGMPLLWFSPDPRWVIPPAELHVPRRLARRLRQGAFRFSLDTAFEQVIAACESAPRVGQGGTWITPEMQAAYTRLHRLGWAHSVETWQGDDLVGGLYGVATNGIFTGESMFCRQSDASKAALITLVRQIGRWGFRLMDAQVHTPHVVQLGARPLRRSAFLNLLRQSVPEASRPGRWQLDADLAVGRDELEGDAPAG